MSTPSSSTPKVLVAYASKHGSTHEIAEAIAERLRADGVPADCRDAGDVKELEGYGAVVLGSAVYMKRWRHEAKRFLHRHRRELAQLPLWVFSSGYVGDAERNAEWEEPAGVVKTVEELGARAHVVFGGRVPQDGGFIAKSMAKNTPPESADRRDWDEIGEWAAGIAGELRVGERV
ncbi:flavodoxin domain-containing protein [Capillimicrobium parvum]|nr:flavodoxin domain-containing protein [Capillimicrobium parvum]